MISADGLREWLKKIPFHDLSDGRGLCRIIFAEDFERAMAVAVTYFDKYIRGIQL